MGENTTSLLAIGDALVIHHSLVASAALGESHVGVVGIEQILSALVVLDVASAERAVQLLGGAAQLLGDLRGGVAGDAIQDVVGVEGFRHQSVDVALKVDDFLSRLLDFHHLLVHDLVELADAGRLLGDEVLALCDDAVAVLNQCILLSDGGVLFSESLLNTFSNRALICSMVSPGLMWK